MKAMEDKPGPAQNNQGAAASWVDSGKSTDSHTSQHQQDQQQQPGSLSRAELERLLTEKTQIALVSRFSQQREELERVMVEDQQVRILLYYWSPFFSCL
jgi:hypothetical protein